MRISRLTWARTVLVATLAGAAWVYTYSVTTVVQYVDAYGFRYHPSQVTTEQPWWSPYATFALLVVGGVITRRLLPRDNPFRALVGRHISGAARRTAHHRVRQAQ